MSSCSVHVVYMCTPLCMSDMRPRCRADAIYKRWSNITSNNNIATKTTFRRCWNKQATHWITKPWCIAYVNGCLFQCLCVFVRAHGRTGCTRRKDAHLRRARADAAHAHTHTYIYIYIYIYTHTHVWGVAHARIHARSMYVCMCVYRHIYIYIAVRVCRASAGEHKGTLGFGSRPRLKMSRPPGV